MKKYWKVGELATLTGLTIRTLRYYDQIGLFSPSQYTDSGHRLYNQSDLTKLQQILALKYMGLSLEDIQAVLDNGTSYQASGIIETQIARIKSDIQIQQNLLLELEQALDLIKNNQTISMEQLTRLLGAMKMNHQKYFTSSQLEKMRKYYLDTDSEKMKAIEVEFHSVLEQIRHEMKNGTPPSNKKVQKLAQEWSHMARSFMEDDPELQKSVETFHANHPGNELQYGIDATLYRYINQALMGK